jgi:putative FmdB family regulatory protein
LALGVCECQEDDVPTYQYACTACGHQLEAVQSFADEPLTECPACEGRLRKLFSSVGVVFKGSGFYRTDSRAAAATGDGPAKNGKDGKDGAAKDSSTSSDSGTSTKDTAKAAPASTPKKETAAPATT